MAQSKKELVLAAMDNKPVDRVPSGFWFHFLDDEIHSDSFQHPELMEKVFEIGRASCRERVFRAV